MASQYQYRKPYLDSSVFIAWLKGEVEVGTGVDRGKIGTHIMNLAAKGEYLIYASAWSLAEVHKPRGGTALADDQDERILAFFENDFIRLIVVDRLIGEQANRLCRLYGLKPGDAVHLACALRAGCDVLLAWDGDLLKVSHPDINIERPQMLGQGDFAGS